MEKFCTHCQRFKRTEGRRIKRGNQMKWICQPCIEHMEDRRRAEKVVGSNASVL